MAMAVVTADPAHEDEHEHRAASWALAEANQTLEAKVAERTKELADQQSFTRALLETAGVGIVSCDAEGGNWVRNRAERGMLGLPIEAMEGGEHEGTAKIDVFDQLGNRLDVASYPMMRALRGEDVGEVELLLGPSGGALREVMSRSSQILSTTGEVLGAVSTLTDISVERAAARALDRQQRALVEAQRIGQLGSFEYEFATDSWTFSEQMAALWGLDAADFDPLVTQSLIVDDDREAAWAAWQRACRDGGRHQYEYRIRRANDGAERLLRSTVEVTLDPSGTMRGGRGTHLDITELVEAERAARVATVFLNAVLAATPDYTFVTEPATGRLVYGSPNMDVLGITTDQLELLGPSAIGDLVHPEDRERLRAINVASVDLQDGDVMEMRYRARHADGRWRWLDRRITPFRRGASGAVVEILGVLRDVSEIKEGEERLRYVALHDDLTGLPNRPLLIDRLDAAIERSGRDLREVAVLFCDLDGFKRVNDTCGHAAGDEALLETTRRLTHVVRGADTVARVGGDEFVIIVEPWNRPELEQSARTGPPTRADDRSLAVQVAERIGEALSTPITIDGIDHVVTISIGITWAALAPGAAPASVTAEQLLQDADAAMYVAKERGKNRFEIFTPRTL
jgi:PAS domain S-box-containing protein